MMRKSVLIPEELHERLKSEADARGVTIPEIISAVLDKPGKAPELSEHEKRKKWARELMKKCPEIKSQLAYNMSCFQIEDWDEIIAKARTAGTDPRISCLKELCKYDKGWGWIVEGLEKGEDMYGLAIMTD